MLNICLVLTVVGPRRLATSQMVDDQQNVDPVFVSAYGLRISTLLGFDLPSFSVWPLQSTRCAIESRNKSLVKSVDPMAPKPTPIIYSIVLTTCESWGAMV